MADLQEQFDARLKRVADAVQLKEPDRVPIVPVFQAFPVYLMNKWSIQELMDDYTKSAEVYDNMYDRYQPDLGWDPILFYPTNYMERTGIEWFRWPGKHFDNPKIMYQFIEDQYMRGDEYEEAIFDITKYMMNKWLPRSFANLSGLSKIDFRNTMWFGHMGAFAAFSDPEVISAFETLADAGRMLMDWFIYLGGYQAHMKEKYGIPPLYAGFAYAPFDMIGDTMRGTVDIYTDMYDRPDELLRLLDVVADFAVKDAVAGALGKAVPYVWIWLHKGTDDFMSDEHYAKFYWPTLRKLIVALADAGLTPVVYAEGKNYTRLEHFKDVPKGKVIYNFEFMDMAKAKKVLGDVACIAGNVPWFTLAHGTPEETSDCVKQLIDTCAPGGGYILDTATMIDDAKPENIDAMFETCFTYGAR